AICVLSICPELSACTLTTTEVVPLSLVLPLLGVPPSLPLPPPLHQSSLSPPLLSLPSELSLGSPWVCQIPCLRLQLLPRPIDPAAPPWFLAPSSPPRPISPPAPLGSLSSTIRCLKAPLFRLHLIPPALSDSSFPPAPPWSSVALAPPQPSESPPPPCPPDPQCHPGSYFGAPSPPALPSSAPLWVPPPLPHPTAHPQLTICAVGLPQVCQSPSVLWLEDPLTLPPAS
ncbi:hypothetical protein M9458_046648, partial [Cirrhinus mrigala]